MRRAVLALVLTCAAAGALPALAADAPDPAGQTFSGTVAAPTPGGVTGAPRRLALASTATNGVLGWYVDVAPQTVGGTFTLTKTTDGQGTGDLDVIFYTDPGDIANGAPTAAATYATVAPGGEAGVVPDGARTALVYLTSGAQVGFDYAALPPVPLALSSASLDLAVPKGRTVRVVNDTAGPLTLASVARDEFDAPLFATDELAPGASATLAPLPTGSYPFTAGDRTGTLTVG